jgi:hypothetical protein
LPKGRAVLAGLASQGGQAGPTLTPATGQISPLAAQYAQWTLGRTPANVALPRDPMEFLTGAFGPLMPITPVGIDEPPEGTGRPEPRRWQYPVGWNMPMGMPGTEGLKLADFQTLRLYADLYCLAPETRVLCSDLAWRQLSKVSIGDELVAFDEYPRQADARAGRRKLRMATVTSRDVVVRPTYIVRLKDGREVTASAEHMWLAAYERRAGGQCRYCGMSFPAKIAVHEAKVHGVRAAWRDGVVSWITTAELRPGSRIRDLGKPWTEDMSKGAGYLAGVYDGEGSLAKAAGFKVSFSQYAGKVLDETERLLKEKDYHYTTVSCGKRWTGSPDLQQLNISTPYHCLRFLGECRPLRLLEKVPAWLEGRCPSHSSRADEAVVESVEFIGERELLAVGTSTSTLIAEGLFSHNSVARACIQLRKDEMLGVGWDIGPTDDAAKAMRGDAAAMADFGKRKAEAVKFFSRPDPNFVDFSSWFDAVLEDMLVIDAIALYLHPSSLPGKGLFGSSLGALDVLDGSLIRPLVDLRGSRPAPPNPAFQWYEYGIPRVDLMTMLNQDDIKELGPPVKQYRGDQLMYLVRNPRTWTVYGQAPIERCVIPLITGLRKQQWAMDFFQEGSIPGVYISPGDANMTPNQIREVQDALNAIAGDVAYKHKVIMLPANSKVDPQKPPNLADQSDEVIMTQVLMAFSVMPMELGITPRMSSSESGGGGGGASAGAANQMAKSSQATQERKCLKPDLMWFKSALFDRILQDLCGQKDMQWVWDGLEEDQDEETQTNLLVTQIGAGLSSIDEARIELGKMPWGLPITSDPGWASPTAGFTPLGQMSATGAPEPLVAPPPPPGAPPGGAPGGPPGGFGGPPPGAPSAPAAAPGNAGQSPAHHAQEATAGAAGATPHIQPKAIASELDMLRRHLMKGRQISSWDAVHIPAHTLAVISEDLAKGLSPEQAIGIQVSLLPREGVVLEKVGPKGYIHGWICVRPPCGEVGSVIAHPDHGAGIVTGKDPLRGRFEDGAEGKLGKQRTTLLGESPLHGVVPQLPAETATPEEKPAPRFQLQEDAVKLTPEEEKDLTARLQDYAAHGSEYTEAQRETERRLIAYTLAKQPVYQKAQLDAALNQVHDLRDKLQDVSLDRDTRSKLLWHMGIILAGFAIAAALIPLGAPLILALIASTAPGAGMEIVDFRREW